MEAGREEIAWLKCDKCGTLIEILPLLSSNKIDNKFIKLYCDKCKNSERLGEEKRICKA
ncbi:MAG: hypothetical protein V1891_00985 [bacterium]